MYRFFGGGYGVAVSSSDVVASVSSVSSGSASSCFKFTNSSSRGRLRVGKSFAGVEKRQ